MEVLARLSPPFLLQLRSALRAEHVLHVAEDWSALTNVVRARPIDLMIADPMVEGVMRTSELRALLMLYPSVPVVLYSALSPHTVRATAELAPLGIREVVLRGFDDDPVRLRALVERLAVYSVSEGLIDRVSARLAGCPPLLAMTVVRLFRDPAAFGSVNDLVVAAGLSRRSMDRWLARRQLPSARMLISLARLARAYHYLRDPGCMAEDVSRKMGYASPRGFAKHARAVTGLNPTDLREEGDPAAFTERMAALLWLRPESGHDVSAREARTGSR